MSAPDPNPTSSPGDAPAMAPADRGLPSVNRVTSVQTRISRALAFTLMAGLGGSLLLWYYSGAATRNARFDQAAKAAVRSRASGDSTLPPLGHVETPRTAASMSVPTSLVSEPPAPSESMAAGAAPAMGGATASSASPPTPTPAETALSRRLSGAVFAPSSSLSSSSSAPGAPMAEPTLPTSVSVNGSTSPGALGDLLKPSVLPAAQARVLPTRELLLPKGAFLDCTLETAIDSTLPGLVTCVTATDTFSADGRVVLLERGTKLIGETRSEVSRGAARLFVLWSEARTPTGVVVELASPATDALGRAGLSGEVERHFWARFGSAILISVIDGAIQAGVEASRSSGSSSVVVSPSGAQGVMTEVLKETAALAPSIRIAQGSPVQVLVARDLDFRSVYVLERVDAPAR